MEFNRFSSITDYADKRTLRDIELLDVQRPKAFRKWVLTEKIHGANFSMKTDGWDYLAASRNGFADNFYGSAPLVAGFKPTVLKLHDDYGGLLEVFGELYGGGYFQSVLAALGITNPCARIGKGVHYTYNRAFRCFDIKHNGIYINEGVRQRVCHSYGIPTIPWMKIGTFQELLNEPVTFRSTIPGLEGLDEDMDEENFAEGWVLKPLFEMTLSNGKRAILKGRSEKWAQKSKQSVPRVKQKEPVPEHIQVHIDELSKYATVNRLRSVMSHLGPVTGKEFGKVQGAFFKDAWGDFAGDGNAVNFKLKTDKRIFNKGAIVPFATVLKGEWVKIIDGNF